MKPIILLFIILAGIFSCHASGIPEKTQDKEPAKFCGFLLEQAGGRQKITFNFLAFFSGQGIPFSPSTTEGLKIMDSQGKRLRVSRIFVDPALDPQEERKDNMGWKGVATISIETDTPPSAQAAWVEISGHIPLLMASEMRQAPVSDLTVNGEEIHFSLPEKKKIVRNNSVHIRARHYLASWGGPHLSWKLFIRAPDFFTIHSLSLSAPQRRDIPPVTYKKFNSLRLFEKKLPECFVFNIPEEETTLQLHLSYFGNLQPAKCPIHCRVSLGGEIFTNH